MNYNNKTRLFDDPSNMIEKINKIGNIPQIKIVSVDFVSQQILVMTEALYNKKILGLPPSFKDVMESVEFLRISDNFAIRHVNFLTGEILTEWYENSDNKLVLADMTQKEIDLLRNGQKIMAIKAVRERTGLGLADAKHMTDAAEALMRLTKKASEIF